MSTIDSTLAERGARYGEFPEHAFITQEIKRTLHDSENWGGLADDMKEALDMVAHKIGRIINGDPNYIDSWTDIIGYTRLVEKRLIGAEQEAAKDLMQGAQAAKDNVVPIGSAKPAEACSCLGCQLEAMFTQASKSAA